MKKSEKVGVNPRTIHFITIIGLFIILISFVLFTKNQEELVTENITLAEEIEVLTKEIENLDSIKVINEDFNKVKSLVSEYYRYRNFYQLDSLLLLLSDTLERFYLLENISKEEIKKDFERYWKNNSSSRYFIDFFDMEVSINEDGNYEITFSSFYSKNLENIRKFESTLKINNQLKIYFARDIFSN